MKKLVMVVLALSVACAEFAASPIYYLEMVETGIDPTGGDVPLFVRVEVSSKEQALTMRDSLAPTIFGAKPHRDTFHTHNFGSPCVEELLP